MSPLLIALACLASGPCCSSIDQAAKMKQLDSSLDSWKAMVAGDTTIELPEIKTTEYRRVAPASFRLPMPTKTVPKWCPAWPTRLHGYSCGMQQAVEDLAGHLQTVHGLSLERINSIDRSHWQDLHDDTHWKDYPAEKKTAYLRAPEVAPKKIVGYRKVCHGDHCTYEPIFQ